MSNHSHDRQPHGGLYLNGSWQAGLGPHFTSIDPASEEVVFAAHAATATQVEQAVAAARAAFPAWAKTSRGERVAILEAYSRALQARGPSIAEAISRDMGKALWESTAEVGAMVGKIAISVRA